MTKSAYKYMAETWSNSPTGELKELRWQRLIQWRREPAIIRIERPTRLDRARRLGYK
jgi:large subunit ribosomal protein L15e